MYQEGVEEYDDLQEYAEEETKNDAPAADGEKLAAHWGLITRWFRGRIMSIT